MDQQWIACYRECDRVWWAGVGGTALFGSMLVVSVLNPDGSIDDGPLVWTLFFVVPFGAFAAMGALALLSYYQYRLYVSDAGLFQKGVFRKQRILLRDVDELKWRQFPVGGSVRLAGTFGVAKIEFGKFARDERKLLVSFFRERIALDKQVGWDEFNDSAQGARKKRKESPRSRLAVAIFFYANGIAFCGFWFAGFGLPNLVMSLLNVAMAVWITWGEMQKRSRGTTEVNRPSHASPPAGGD